MATMRNVQIQIKYNGLIESGYDFFKFLQLKVFTLLLFLFVFAKFESIDFKWYMQSLIFIYRLTRNKVNKSSWASKIWSDSENNGQSCTFLSGAPQSARSASAMNYQERPPQKSKKRKMICKTEYGFSCNWYLDAHCCYLRAQRAKKIKDIFIN